MKLYSIYHERIYIIEFVVIKITNSNIRMVFAGLFLKRFFILLNAPASKLDIFKETAMMHSAVVQVQHKANAQ